MNDKHNLESFGEFNAEKYEFLKPLLKTILREANQNPKHNRQSIQLFVSVLQERFGYELKTITKMKPYVMKLIDDFKSEKETLD